MPHVPFTYTPVRGGLTFLIYALTFFGIILGSSFIWRLIAGEFPKGTPLVAIWIVALIALIAVGYRRLYMNQPVDSSDEEEPSQEEDEPDSPSPKQAPKQKKKPSTGAKGSKNKR